MGASLTPFLGAFLAKPARSWPSLFSETIFDRYPYALPGVAVAILPFLSVVGGYFLVKETHHKFSSRGQPRPLLRKKKTADYVPLEDLQNVESAHQTDSHIHNAQTMPTPNYVNSGFVFMMVIWVSSPRQYRLRGKRIDT